MHLSRLRRLLVPLALSLLACDDSKSAQDTSEVSADVSVDETSDVAADATPEATDDTVEGRPDTTGGTGVMTDPSAVKTSDIASGKRTLVNAESSASWTYFSFSSGALSNPDEGRPWDLGVQRFLIKLGPGVSAAVLEGQPYADLTTAPSGGYAVDSGAAASSEELVLGPWYDYDMARHTLSPKADLVFVVKTASDAYFKLALRDYYDAAGSSGYVTFDWAELAPPVVQADDIIAVQPGVDTYYDLAGNKAVTSQDKWDIVFRGSFVIGTNGGTSGTAFGAARVADVAWDALTTTDTVGFTRDTSGNGIAGPAAAHAQLSTWFDYNPQTHAASVADKVFIVRGHDGAYYKLRGKTIELTGSSFQFAPLQRAPLDHELVLDASAGRVYADLAQNAIGSSGAWDLALSSVSFQTNGGTSGDGEGGAALLGGDAFSLYSNLSGALASDAMVPVAGPPGSGEESRSAALDAWYTYDPQTHTVSASSNVFVVALADGSRARVMVNSYVGNILTIIYTYAGPGYDSL